MTQEATDTGAFIASHLAEHAKPTSKVVIAAGGIITAPRRAVGYGDRIDRLPVLPEHETLPNFWCQSIVAQSPWPRSLFPTQPSKTTITRPSKLLQDDAIDSEPGGVQGRGAQVGVRDDDDDDAGDAPRVHRHSRHVLAGPSGALPRTAGTSSSGAVGPFMF